MTSSSCLGLAGSCFIDLEEDVTGLGLASWTCFGGGRNGVDRGLGGVAGGDRGGLMTGRGGDGSREECCVWRTTLEKRYQERPD